MSPNPKKRLVILCHAYGIMGRFRAHYNLYVCEIFTAHRPSMSGLCISFSLFCLVCNLMQLKLSHGKNVCVCVVIIISHSRHSEALRRLKGGEKINHSCIYFHTKQKYIQNDAAVCVFHYSVSFEHLPTHSSNIDL